MTLIIALVIINIVIIGVSFYIMVRLNNYIEKNLENKIEKTLIEVQNLKQSFRNVLVDSSFLLDDSKIKKTMMEETKVNIYNGNNLNEENVEF